MVPWLSFPESDLDHLCNLPRRPQPGCRIYHQMPTRKSASARPRPSAKTSTSKAKSTKGRRPGPKRRQAEKDPEGGLTAQGRKAFARKEGSHLRPGVKGAADTPEKMRRKGSFLRRHFAEPRGPMQREGKPTRLALSAHAWGEPIPKTLADARRLAAKGKKLLEKYQRAKPKP